MSTRTKPTDAYVGKEDAFQVSAMGFVRRIVKAAGHAPQCAMHVPNGGARSVVVGAKLKAAGVVRGYPDIMIFAPESQASLRARGRDAVARCGLALELKVWPNKPTADQAMIHEMLREAGWRVAVCWSLDAVIAEVTGYFANR